MQLRSSNPFYLFNNDVYTKKQYGKLWYYREIPFNVFLFSQSMDFTFTITERVLLVNIISSS